MKAFLTLAVVLALLALFHFDFANALVTIAEALLSFMARVLA